MALRLPRWESLSNDEQVPIANLPLDKDYIITGGPGTGKTILALYRASRLEEVHSTSGVTKTIKFLVYNKTLYEYLKQAITEIGLSDADVQNWHKWFYKYYFEKYHRYMPETSPYNPDWQILLKEFDNEMPIFDHLLIDEAQDLPKELMKILRKLCKNCTIFADENQAIDQNATNIAEITNAFDIPGRRYYLSKNYRNTQEIAAVAYLFYSGDTADLPAKSMRSGPKPYAIKVQDIDEVTQFIADHGDNFPESNIGVLVPPFESNVNTYFHKISEKTSISKCQMYKSKSKQEFSFEQDAIKVLTYLGVKGLEFDTVFLPEIDSAYFTNNRKIMNQMHVCCSRAKNQLYFSYCDENSNSFVLQMLKKNNAIINFMDSLSLSTSEVTF